MAPRTRRPVRQTLVLLTGLALTAGDAVSAAVEKGSEGAAPSPVEIEGDHLGLSVSSADGRYKFAFGGRLQVDGGGFVEDRNDLGSGVELRRARIKSFGHVWYDWMYKLEVNFDTDENVPVTDGWLRYRGDKLPFHVTIGHQKVPFSQQSMASSNWLVFVERGLPDAFIDSSEVGRRRLGVVVGDSGTRWNASAGVFAEGVATAGSGDEDFGTAARGVWAPLIGDGELLVFDGAVYYRRYSRTGAADQLRFRTRPESHISAVRLVDTGSLGAISDHILYNLGNSGGFGPIHFQAEYTGTHVTRTGAENVYLKGYYVQAGWFITGENRVFNMALGKFMRPRPERRLGAWEVAMRWSGIDLMDEDIVGGKENNFTLGINWWTNLNVMFRFNYIYGRLRPNSAAPDAEGDPVLTSGGVDEDVHGFVARAQLVF